MTRVRLGRPGDGGAVLLVAEDGGRPVGSAVLHRSVRDPAVRAALPDVPELSNLTVDAGVRRRGHGTALITAAARAAADEGCSALAVAVSDGNQDAARLYLRLGFRETGLRSQSPEPVRFLALDLHPR